MAAAPLLLHLLLVVIATIIITPTAGNMVPNPDLIVSFLIGVPTISPSNIYGAPLSLTQAGAAIVSEVGPDQATSDAVNTKSGGFFDVTLISTAPEAEAGCTYRHDPCVCLLRCPTWQTRYGDGSACQGGGLPNCDLGYCHSNPNSFSPCDPPMDQIPLLSSWTIDV